MASGVIRDRIVCSGALFYAKDTGRILLLQKSAGKHAGTWGLVGGTTDLGESAWQGLQREITEEIGTPPAILICSFIKSKFITSSVMVCST